jgi:hypothetical protein
LRINGDAIHGTRPGGVATTADGRDVAFTTRPGTTYAIVRGAPEAEVAFPLDEPGDGAEVRMLGNDRVLPHKWHDGMLRVRLPDHLPAAPATAFAVRG